MFKVFEQVVKFTMKAMENCKVELTVRGQSLTKFQIRGIFQEDLLPLLFVIEMILPNYTLGKCKGSYRFTTGQEKVNHLIYMDDIKIFVKNKNELESLTQIARIFSLDIGMELRMKKSTILIMNKGKRETTKRTEWLRIIIIQNKNERKQKERQVLGSCQRTEKAVIEMVIIAGTLWKVP